MDNLRNADNNYCFKWCLVSFLNPANHHPTKITEAGKDFAQKFHLRDIKRPVKTRVKTFKKLRKDF